MSEKRAAPSRYRSLSLSPAYESDKDRPVHPMTAEGTLIHEALEKDDPSKLNEFQRVLYDRVKEVLAKILPANAWVTKEMRFPILGADYGFGDLIALSGNVGYYVDYKMGAKKQAPVEENPAAQAYALGIMTHFTYVTEVRVYYIYPRLEVVDFCRYYRGDIDRIVATIQLIKARHDVATPETCAFHEDTCTYCRHLATCPTARAALLPTVNRYAEGRGLPCVPDLSQVTDPEKWARLLDVKPVLAQMAASIAKHAMEFRGEIPGYVREYVEGKRTVNDARAFVEALEEKGVDRERIFAECCTVSITKAIELLREVTPRGQKKKVMDSFLGQLQEGFVIGSTQGYYKLVKEKAYGGNRLQQPESGDGPPEPSGDDHVQPE